MSDPRPVTIASLTAAEVSAFRAAARSTATLDELAPDIIRLQVLRTVTSSPLDAETRAGM